MQKPPFLPWTDGETIPDSRIRDIFQTPPGLQKSFFRSTLLIGSRGVGKTTLFRYLKATHQGLALHISLGTALAALPRQTGLGPLRFDVPQSLADLLVSKATSLLALALTERVVRKDIKVRLDALWPCLPSSLRRPRQRITSAWCAAMTASVGSADLRDFASVSPSRPLVNLTSSIAEAVIDRQGQLLLLLDRADMVSPAVLSPIVELLDQSGPYVAIVATRPGHASDVLQGSSAIQAGDHYEVVHLGTNPYNAEWVDFVVESVSAQLGRIPVERIASPLRDGAVALARDSLRTALELFARCASSTVRHTEAELHNALDGIHSTQLIAAQKTLQRHSVDFRRLVSESRKELLEGNGLISGPVLLNVESRGLFDNSRLDQFIAAALRAGALAMPSGQGWLPGLKPRDVELPPLLVWQKGDPLWPASDAHSLRIRRTPGTLMKAAGGPAKAPTIFVAYRMQFPESVAFRRRIQQEIENHPDLSILRITDGHVPVGTHWAPEIRERISRAKLLIGDVTGLRNEVIFELGLGFGLRKSIIPVVGDESMPADLPRWLSSIQVANYSTDIGLLRLMAGIESQLAERELVKGTQPSDPVPGTAAWLGSWPWNEHAREEFRTVCLAEGLTADTIDHDSIDDDKVIKRATKAAVLFISFNGGRQDALFHFIAGAIVAHPKAGHAQGLSRALRIVQAAPAPAPAVVADSLRRCSEIVAVITPEAVRSHLKSLASRHRVWSHSKGQIDEA